jgi:predicted nucleotidyltransferase
MHFHGLPQGLLSSAGRVTVISTLLREPARVWTGSALARAAGVTPRWAIETLRALAAEGVVHPEVSPPSWRWTLNRRHLLVKMLGSLSTFDVASQAALLKELKGAVAPLNPISAIWFGSTARGDESSSSDVDLLVVVRDGRQRTRAREFLAKRGGPFYWKFGNRLAPVVLTAREFEQRKGGGFVAQALDHGVWVEGGPTRG